MAGPFDDTDEADAADRARGRNDATHVDAEARDLLRSTVHRVEDLLAQKAELQADIKELMDDAKGKGIDTKIVRQVIKRRAMDKAEREQQDTLLELYEGVFA
jgi:uncharacterized protein (UPF0335 family)